MKKVKQIAAKLFHKPEIKVSGGGLYATPEELMEQRQFVRYLRNVHKVPATSIQAGDVKSVFKGRGMEFEEIRPYAFGDDVRDIDWRVTARKLSPYTKLFAEERDREVYVLLDLSPKMLFGTKKELKTVTAAKIAALLGWMSLENKDRFGCVVFDGEHSSLFKPQNHRAGLLALLNKISEVSRRVMEMKSSPAASSSLDKPLQLLQNTLKSRAIVFVVSDFDDISEKQQKNLAMLARRSSLACINVLDILEENPPAAGEYMAEYAGRHLVFDSAPQEYRRGYRAYFAEKRKAFKNFCRKFSCRYLEVRTDLLLYRQLKDV